MNFDKEVLVKRSSLYKDSNKLSDEQNQLTQHLNESSESSMLEKDQESISTDQTNKGEDEKSLNQKRENAGCEELKNLRNKKDILSIVLLDIILINLIAYIESYISFDSCMYYVFIPLLIVSINVLYYMMANKYEQTKGGIQFAGRAIIQKLTTKKILMIIALILSSTLLFITMNSLHKEINHLAIRNNQIQTEISILRFQFSKSHHEIKMMLKQNQIHQMQYQQQRRHQMDPQRKLNQQQQQKPHQQQKQQQQCRDPKQGENYKTQHMKRNITTSEKPQIIQQEKKIFEKPNQQQRQQQQCRDPKQRENYNTQQLKRNITTQEKPQTTHQEKKNFCENYSNKNKLPMQKESAKGTKTNHSARVNSSLNKKQNGQTMRQEK